MQCFSPLRVRLEGGPRRLQVACFSQAMLPRCVAVCVVPRHSWLQPDCSGTHAVQIVWHRALLSVRNAHCSDRRHAAGASEDELLSGVIVMSTSRGLRWAGHVAPTGKLKNAYKILVGKHQGKWKLGRPKRRREAILKLRKPGYSVWTVLIWRCLVNRGMNLRVP